MGDLIQLISFMKLAPSEVTIFLAAFAVLVTMWLNSRKVDIETATSIGKLQQENMAVLLKQNRELSDDLADLRKTMKETYETLDKMRHQISHLESIVLQYQKRCDSCPFMSQQLNIQESKVGE